MYCIHHRRSQDVVPGGPATADPSSFVPSSFFIAKSTNSSGLPVLPIMLPLLSPAASPHPCHRFIPPTLLGLKQTKSFSRWLPHKTPAQVNGTCQDWQALPDIPIQDSFSFSFPGITLPLAFTPSLTHSLFLCVSSQFSPSISRQSNSHLKCTFYLDINSLQILFLKKEH